MKKILIALTMAGLLVFAFFTVKNAYREIKRNRQIQEEVQALEQEAENLKKSNQNLKEKIAYFETQDYQELEAKRELSFQKPDENVVIVKPNALQSSGENNDVQANDLSQSKKSIPNYRKWYNLFFQ
jgi:cell division protein FtsB